MHEEGAQHFRAVLPPALASVSRVRRDVREAAARWHVPVDVAADAALIVSELATNAVLHARTAFTVVAHRLGHLGIRLEVTDASGDPVLSPVAPPTAVSGVLEDLDELDAIQHALNEAGTTGRGLALVAELSDTWGVSPRPDGKTVWAELGKGAAKADASGEIAVLSRPAPSERVCRVLLVAVPVRLVAESDRHFDDLLRELQVMALAGEGGRLGALADKATLHLGGMRQAGRQATREGLARGDRLIDIELLVPPDADVGFRCLETLLHEVAAESRAGRLLTELPNEEVNAFRRWYRAEVEGQLAGRLPRPCPFPTVPERQAVPARPPSPNVDRQRRDQLAGLRARLSSLTDPRAAAEAVVAAAVGTLAGLRGALFLVAPDQATVRLAAHVGYPEEIAGAWRRLSVRTDVPAAECIRTQRAVILRTRAERDRRYPHVNTLKMVDDPSVVCIPLRGADSGIGCLSLTFRQGRAMSTGQLSFLQEMADAAAEWFAAAG